METLRSYRPGQVRYAITDASGDTRRYRALPNQAFAERCRVECFWPWGGISQAQLGLRQEARERAESPAVAGARKYV